MLSSLTALIGPVSNLLDQFVEDKDKKNALVHEIATLADKHHQELMLAQISVNREEAKGNWFQSSWRPATAWVCVAGIAINFLVSPLAAPFGIIVPQVDTSVTMPLLLGLLGLTTARTYERVKKVGK
jgi:hypothetical protein|tara:strand:+ start:609 stop:989 length:381 start_codon:yes stop_codon:yes gene_type:complete